MVIMMIFIGEERIWEDFLQDESAKVKDKRDALGSLMYIPVNRGDCPVV